MRVCLGLVKIGEICREAGCEDCITFDGGLKGATGFTVLR
jgi:hypothetical protein